MLGLRTADRQLIFPTWQISEHQVLPGLTEVLGAFRGQPLWSVGLWLTTPHPGLDDRTPVQVLEAGVQDEQVRDLAQATAVRWS